jgi:hypothetical protein
MNNSQLLINSDTQPLTRWNDDGPLQADYIDDCMVCERESFRSELFWAGDLLVCSDECEHTAAA